MTPRTRAAILLATRSNHKAREIREILAPLRLDVHTLAEIESEATAEEDELEVYDSFQANAIAKARYFAARHGRTAVADDSGLRVDALGGEPGVRTKRFSGRADLHGPDLDEANNELLLDKLRDVPWDRRGAHYVCAAAIAWPEGRALTAIGSVAGVIATEPRGQAGFGYDPIFHVPALDARFAEVDPAVKDGMSHRARAFRALAAALDAAPWDPA
jgi:XTP/dITP diphosphohydrolase